MSDLEVLAERYEDPIRFLCTDAIQEVRPRRLALMSAWVMSRLPFKLPNAVVKYVERGVKQELTSQMKREVTVGRERQRWMVPLDGEWDLLSRQVLAGYDAFINDLKRSVKKDRSRIKFHEDQYEHYRAIAERVPNGDRLTLDQLSRFDSLHASERAS